MKSQYIGYNIAYPRGSFSFSAIDIGVLIMGGEPHDQWTYRVNVMSGNSAGVGNCIYYWIGIGF